MADKEFRDLPENITPQDDDVIPMQRLAGGAGSTQRYSLQTLKTEIAPDLALIGRVLVTKTVNQSMASGADVVVSWDGEEYDTLNAWTSGTDIIVPSGAAFMRNTLNAGLSGTPTGSGAFQIDARLNGVGIIGGAAERIAINTNTSFPRSNGASSFIPVSENDVITVRVVQTSGASMDLQGSALNTWALVEWYA